MGAAQSKKRQKERKRKRKMPGGHDFDMPRSASVDVLHTFNVTSCSLCQQLSHRRAVFHSLESSHQHLHHNCLGSLTGDGYESCPSCSNSTYCLTRLRSQTDIENSTMSLNRNLKGRSSRLTQSKSSQFDELLDILKDHEHERGKKLSNEESQSALTSDSVATRTVASVTPSQTPVVPTSQPAKLDIHKKVISILEDEASRLARWERQKLMAQQLRTLRKHIQLQEAAAAETENIVLPIPVMRAAKDMNQLCLNTSPEHFCDSSELVSHSTTSKPDSDDTVNVSEKSLPNKFSKLKNYHYLDNHPALSKLQNEQNNRLESMEKRMREIRISALQEAERRKFAEIFPAKEDNTEEILQEARDTLEKMKAEKQRRREEEQCCNITKEIANNSPQDHHMIYEEDSGDIIPVCILPNQGEKSAHTSHQKAQVAPLSNIVMKSNPKSDWLNEAWPNINLGNPFTWLLLPFLMFPLILRMLLTLIINNASTSNNSNSASTSRFSSSHAVPFNSNMGDARHKKT